jgi:hypothetical protein
MTENFVLGIGGTGGRCVESFLHLAAAGLVDGRVWVGLVDQDESNGNIGRTRQLVEKYASLRAAIRAASSSSLDQACPFMKAEVLSPKAGTFWCPLPGTNRNLYQIYNYELLHSEMQLLMDGLYSKTEEQQLRLDEGFRGRPSVGAAAILSQTFASQPFWEELFNAINAVKGGEKVRIFLMGSVFGGTGAAGLPTIARLIRDEINKRKISRNIHIACSLMLPYFSYPHPDPTEDQNVAFSEAFIEQAQGSMKYYAQLLTDHSHSSHRIFDQIFLAGWDPLFRVGYFQKGGSTQTNPPLLPELYAALAAAKFFGDDDVDGGNVFLIGRQGEPKFDWTDLPSRTANRSEVQDLVGQLLRFSLAFLWIYRPALSLETWSKYRRESWFQRSFSKQGLGITNNDVQLALLKTEVYAKEFLRWFSGMIFASEGQNLQVNLAEKDTFAVRNSTDPTGLPDLLLSPNVHQIDKFSTLVLGARGLSLSEIFEKVSYDSAAQGNRGIGTFLGLLYDSCAAQKG